jgi:HlyD family secretion protein
MTGAPTKEKVESKTKPGLPARRITIVVCLLVASVAAVAAIFFFSSKGAGGDWKKNTVKVKKGSVDVKIVATGTIRPVNEIKVSPKSTGLIKKLYVQQGDIVKEGQVIARMDDSNLKGQVESAQGNYLMAKDNYLKMLHGNRPQEIAIARYQERRAVDIVRQAEQNLTRLKANVDSMTEQLKRDETAADRQTYLESQGAISAQDLLNAQTQAKVMRAQLEAAKREYAQAEATLAQNKAEYSSAEQQHELSKLGNRAEDIQSAKDAIVQAKGNLDTLLSNLDDMNIKAPFSGVVTQKYADAGAIVTPTTSAATTSATSSSIIALAGRLEMVAQVAETDIGKIELGQAVEIISNAYPEHVFHGKVTQIAPEAVVTQNVTTFEVHSSIDDDRKQRLLSGMNVSAKFVAGTIDDALLVPTACIVSRHGQNGVLIPEADGTPKFKKVRTGPTENTDTVIMKSAREGAKNLEEGDLVFIGLSKEQLEKQGYSESGGPGGGRQGGRGGGGAGGAPIPRGFGR